MTQQTSSYWLDGVGVGISGLCILHCLLLPLIIALAPAWSSWLALPEDLHVWLLAMALPFSGIVLWRASKRYTRTKVSLGLGVAGLALMSVGIFVEKENAEVFLTTAGAGLVAIAHLRNWRCRGHQVSTRRRSSANQ